jgi:Family of unknown function (DUF5988)
METVGFSVSGPGTVLAVLEGGPASLPESLRVQQVGLRDDKIKIVHYGGYEHFERDVRPGANASSHRIVFRWTMRTEMAE